MSAPHHRRPSEEPSVVVRNEGGRRVVSRTNKELSYAYGAPTTAAKKTRKRRASAVAEEAADDSQDLSASASSSEQPEEVQPDPKERYANYKKRKVQQKVEKVPIRPQASPKKTIGKVSQVAPETRQGTFSRAGSDAVSSSAAAGRRRATGSDQSRGGVSMHGQLNSFYMDRDGDTEEDSLVDAAMTSIPVPSSILLGAQRQPLDMLGAAAPEMDSIHSSDLHDSRSRDYAEMQREADALAEAEGSSVSGSLRGVTLSQRNGIGRASDLKNGKEFQGKGKGVRMAARSSVKGDLNGIREESDDDHSAPEGRKHSQHSPKKSGSVAHPVATVAKQWKPISRSSPPRQFPWLILAVIGLAAATLFGLMQRGMLPALSDISLSASNSTLGDKLLLSRVDALGKRLNHAEKQSSEIRQLVSEARSLSERIAKETSKLPDQLAQHRAQVKSSEDNTRNDLHTTLTALRKELEALKLTTHTQKEQRSDGKPAVVAWDTFLQANEKPLRAIATTVVAEELRKGDAVVSRSAMVDELQREIGKMQTSLQTRFNENAQEMQNDILAKVRTQQEMFERAGSWKKQPVQQQNSHLPDLGNARESIIALMDEALERFAADRIGERDFALFSAGARVVPSMTSATYSLRPRSSSLLGWLGGSGIERVGVTGQPPVVALVPDNAPGLCWAFAGAEGQLGISLARRVVVSKVTLEHAPASISHEGGISAPRDVSIWGIVERPSDVARLAAHRRERQSIDQPADSEIAPTPAPPSDRHVLLASVTYDAFSGRAVQSFPISDEAAALQIPVALVQIRIHSNHGKAEYTCLYRVRVHGQEWMMEDELAADAVSSDPTA